LSYIEDVILIKIKVKIIEIVSVLLLMFLVTSSTCFQAIGYLGNNQTPFTIKTTDTVVDDFSTDLFRDAASDVFGWGSGTLTNERNFTWTSFDFYPTISEIRDLVVQGRKVYATGYNDTSSLNSLLAFDINDPSDIKLLSTRNSMTGLQAAAIDGDIFYGGKIPSSISPSSILGVYNVSNPYDLNAAGVYISGDYPDGFVTDISFQGHLVYYTSFNDTSNRSFRLVDVKNPYSFNVITPEWVNNKALGLDVDRHFAYIAASDDGFYILNVSNKNFPVEVGHLSLSGNATDVLLDGTVAYVTLGDDGIASVDISDPTNPQLLGINPIAGYSRHMALQGNTLFVTGGAAGLRVFDVADPTHISLVSEYPIPLPFVWDVELFGDKVVVGTSDGIHILGIAAVGGGFTDLSNTETVSFDTGYEVLDVEVKGNIAYIAGGVDGFYTVDVSDPMSPAVLDRWNTTGLNFRKLNVNGQFAHCVDYYDKEYIFDITNPNQIEFVRIVSGVLMTDIMSVGGLSFLSFKDMVGIGNNSLPASSFSVVDTYMIGTNITCIYVVGRLMFVGEYLGFSGAGWHVFDIRNPWNIKHIYTRTGVTSWHNEFVVEGDILFSANGRWLHLWNISDLSSVYLADYIDYGAGNIVVSDIQPFGTNIYLAKKSFGVNVIDATDVHNIIEGSTYAPATGAMSLAISGDYLYIANKTSLIIQRFFESAADTYIDTNNFAQSKSMFTMSNGSITAATLLIDYYNPSPDPTSLLFEMTADGVNWESVTPNTLHNFTTNGTDLRWRAFFNGAEDRSPHLYQIEITFDYEYEAPITTTPTTPTPFVLSPLWIGIIAGGGGLVLIIIIVVVAISVSKSRKKIPSR